MHEALAQTLKDALAPLDWESRLQELAAYREYSIVFSTSFSFEDQAITHALAKHLLPVRIFTIDTGRLFEETHETFQKTREAYPGLAIDVFYPDADAAQELVRAQGINGFYESVEKRHACCQVRKVEPLKQALHGANIWISGLRREHSDTRGDLPVAEFDAERDIVKIYPLIDVTEKTLQSYIKDNTIPYNPLHDRGYPSIGCAPCTRAVKDGDSPRSGRWWWERGSAQECGLHIVDGKLVRRKQNNA